MADFWLEALISSMATRDRGERDSTTSPGNLRNTYLDLSYAGGAEQSLERRSARCLGTGRRRTGWTGRLVLMVENLQSLCENLDDDFGWKLRQTLQSEPQVMLLASATSRFEGLDDPGQPFFELFRYIILEPLAREECRLLWQCRKRRLL